MKILINHYRSGVGSVSESTELCFRFNRGRLPSAEINNNVNRDGSVVLVKSSPQNDRRQTVNDHSLY
jgi:hypothetical protein